MRLTEQLSMFDTNSDCDTNDASSSSSSKETSPTGETPTLSSSVPNIYNYPKKLVLETELQFDNDYFKNGIDERDRGGLNHSFRSVRLSKPKMEGQSLSFDCTRRHGSLRYDFKSSASLEQVSYRCLVDGLKNDKRKVSLLPTFGFFYSNAGLKNRFFFVLWSNFFLNICVCEYGNNSRISDKRLFVLILFEYCIAAKNHFDNLSSSCL